MSETEESVQDQPSEVSAFHNFSNHVIAKIYDGNPLPTSLYHYTSALGLMGILGEHKLWFSDAAYMNDGSETIYGVWLANSVVDEFVVEMSAVEKQAGEELKAQIEETAKYFQQIIFCMSARDNLLNQWRDYGKDVVPYCIEFEVDKLKDWSKRNFPIFLTKVVYNQDVQRSLVRELLQAIYVKTMQLRGDREVFEEEEARPLLYSAAAEIVGLTTRFKNPAFEAEEEWRAIVFRTSIEAKVKRKYRNSSLGVVPYYEWCATEEPKQLPVRGVTVGPSPYAQVSDLALKQFLHDNGYGGIRTSFSTIPIRR